MPDWNAIKTQYITGDIGYRELAVEWSVPFRTLADRAKREKWFAERNSYRDRVTTMTLQKVAARQSSDSATKLLRMQEAADNIGKVIANIFDDTEQFQRHIVTVGVGGGETKVEERKYDKVDTKAIKDLTSAMKDLTYVLRNVYDIPTAQEKSSMDIAAERLRMDKAKAEAEKPDEGGVKVEFVSPEEKGWAE